MVSLSHQSKLLIPIKVGVQGSCKNILSSLINLQDSLCKIVWYQTISKQAFYTNPASQNEMYARQKCQREILHGWENFTCLQANS